MVSDTDGTRIELSENAITVLERRYLKRDEQGNPVETPTDMFRRVAENIAQADAQYGAAPAEVEKRAAEFLGVMLRREFMPNSPTLMNAGREFQQLSACFVLPVEDSMESIFETVKNTALIHKSGGGTGFSFSRLRPKDDIVSSTKGVSSGPLSFMQVFDAATEAIKQGGTRRGANMAVLRVDHPDIREFIQVKNDLTKLTNFNISVGLTEEFMRKARIDGTYELINPRSGEAVESVRAREIFDLIVDCAWATGEPGIIFLDRMNSANPTPAVGEIESTNPCGEQPLLPYESCNLGSINLGLMTKGPVLSAEIDWERLRSTVHTAVRFLDNVIDMNRFPLELIAERTRANRKIGLGIMGFADLLIQMGVPYNTEKAVDVAQSVMKFVRDEARAASEQLAEERGVFPNWELSIFNNGVPRKQRNATTTTLAPTGTISMIAGCSSGCEPLFAVAFTRRVLDGDELVEVSPLFELVAKDRGFYSPELVREIAARGSLADIAAVPSDVRRVFVTAHDVTPEWHVRIQAAFQLYTDNAVSKTVNFPHDATREQVAEVYNLAYDLGCKGVTIYRDGCRENQVLSTGATEQAHAPAAPPITEPRARPDLITGTTRAMVTGCGKLYITINEDEAGPFEVFGNMGKAGGCAASQTEAVARLISLALRSGIKAEHVVQQLKGISCHMPAWLPGGGKILSCADAFGKAIERCIRPDGGQLSIDFNGESFGHLGACPECGGPLYHESGCILCHDCGYSQCD
ncbi:MAG: vitamin B12-dependent ribonucleotide reductase [Acidobacteriota bacterium]|nr:vitamin B12-dependent ribonucleotide reductase [Acidobacteriota bacterium]